MTQQRRSVWRQRDFRLAWGAGFVNDTGDWVLMVALPVYVFSETRSGTTTALLFVCELVVATLLGPIGGSLVDRWNLRRCLIATNLAQAAMLLPLLAVQPNRIWPAYIAVIGQAVLAQLNNPANVALIPRVVERQQLTEANAALAASSSLARLVGAPLGGLLVAVSGLGAVVLIDLVSFLGVAFAINFLAADTDPIAPDDPEVARIRTRSEPGCARSPTCRCFGDCCRSTPSARSRRGDSSCCSSCSWSTASATTAPTSE